MTGSGDGTQRGGQNPDPRYDAASEYPGALPYDPEATVITAASR